MVSRRPFFLVALLSLLALAAMTAFMTIGANGNWGFVLPFRGTKLAALLLVAYSIAVSTVLFQTLTNNRILTPAIMGFDALYVLVQTIVVFLFGAGYSSLVGPRVIFVVDAAAMVLFAAIIYRWLLSGEVRSLHLLLLAGVIFGVLFRSLSTFLQRLIDPLDFMVLQDRFFASFNTVHGEILSVAALAVLVASAIGWRFFSTFDVLALGREHAISLGVAHSRVVTVLLILVAVLVSVSTALVGPVTFFGLLVANLAYHLAGTARHSIVLPVAILLAVIILVGGQTLLERLFAFSTALSVLIEFLGGTLFILLLLSGARR